MRLDLAQEVVEQLARGIVEVAHVGAAFPVELVERAGTEAGYPRRVDGSIELGAMQEIPFFLIVPDVPDLSRLPVVIFVGGLGGSMEQGVGVAEIAGRAGVASVIS